ncbi:MAG: transposase [Anaerolineales bacterium]|nr:transposase [Anaerolineales bacterium]
MLTNERAPLFGKVHEDKVMLSALGELAQREWRLSAAMRQEIRLDEFVVMPDHFHAIVFIDDHDSRSGEPLKKTVGAHGRAPLQGDQAKPQSRKPRSLGSLIAAYKAASTRVVRQHLENPDLKVWQRNYYDRVVRNQNELERIREYIAYNPLKLWEGW